MTNDGSSMSVVPADFFTTLKVEPVGRWFLSHWERLQSKRGHSEKDGSFLSDSEDSDSSDDEETVEIEFTDDIAYLRSLDPKNVKDQDHYKVLGLEQLRWKASDDQIKKAHRAKVLSHHPDKRRAKGEDIREDDDYFSCITAAANTVSNPQKRRAFDSVDPTIDDDVPETKKLTKGSFDFYKTFGPFFEKNARWSVKKHVPKL